MNNPGDCPTRTDLEEFNSGRLPHASIDTIEVHLNGCPKCVSRLDALHRESGTWVSGIHDFSFSMDPSSKSLLEEAAYQQFLENARSIVDDMTASMNSSFLARDVHNAGQELPQRIGSYRVLRELGCGGFGVVYLAQHRETNQLVAVKVPRSDESESHDDIFLHEIEAAAKIEHEAIVPILHFGSDDGKSFAVMRYFSNGALNVRMRNDHLTPRQVAALIARIADALHVAHKQGIVHRDIKPANILLDEKSLPYLTDFGLSIHEDHRWLHRGEMAGTRPYMAPEQVRGEAHRLDGRTDIWSLGVVMYELLARQRPFKGDDAAQVIDEIQYREPKPIRQIDDSVPAELERICLKCLSKRMLDRYLTSSDLTDDLQSWLRTSEQSSLPAPVEERPAKLVPKGLRHFEENDADFFLQLLPGPRDREGFPESVRYWKTRVEAEEQSFRVGLLLGPSGSGKSSLVRAGLIPRLDTRIEPVCIDAASRDVAPALLATLHHRFPELEPSLSLGQVLATLREGNVLPAKRKLFIVIDQFEHCLTDADTTHRRSLTEALRQCDGDRVQALLLVRDDFTLLATNFLDALEEPLLQNHNFAVVEAFPLSHARNVLVEFGRAFGALSDPLTSDEEKFLSATIDTIAENDRVSPVRLSLLSEMVKDYPWNVATLRRLGGFSGIGVAFLDELLNGPRANPYLRGHESLVRSVLQVMLPPGGGPIRRGAIATKAIVNELGPRFPRPKAERILKLLDSEVRLLCLSNQPDAEGGVEEAEACYQLTHDALVPILREWLFAAEQNSRQGRARLLLQERAETWAAHPEPRRLPSFLEGLVIRVSARGRRWNDSERRMMRATTSRDLRGVLAWATAASLLLVLSWSAYGWLQGRHGATQIIQSELNLLPQVVVQARQNQPWTSLHLQARRKQLANAAANDPESLRVSLALLALGKSDASDADRVAAALETAQPEEFLIYRQLLRGRHTELRRAVEQRWLQLAVAANRPPQRSVPESLRLRVEQADGLLIGDGAVVQSLPIESFPSLAEALFDQGFRPTCYRPYTVRDEPSLAEPGQQRVAAGWVRDDLQWRVGNDVTPDQLRELDARYQTQGLAIEDVCRTENEPPYTASPYTALWVAADDPGSVHLYIDEPLADFTTALETRSESKWMARGLVRLTADNEPLYTSIWKTSEQEEPRVAGPYVRYASAFGAIFPGMFCTDARLWALDLSRTNSVPTVLAMQRYRWYLDAQLAQQRSDSEVTVAQGAYAKYQLDLGNTDDAIQELTAAIERGPINPRLFEYRAVAYARKGDLDRTVRDVERYNPLSKSSSTRTLFALRVALLRQDMAEARDHLAELHRYKLSDSIRLKIALASTLVAAQLDQTDATQAETLLVDAADQLSEIDSIESATLLESVMTNPDFERLRRSAPGRQVLSKLGYDRQGLIVWREDGTRQTQFVQSNDIDSHLQRCRALAEQGYTPHAVTVQPADDGQLTSSVWMRSRVTEQQVDERIAARLHVALSLELLGAPNALEAILTGDIDRETQQLAVTELKRWGVAPAVIAQTFLASQSNAERLASLAALGHYRLDELPLPLRQQIVTRVKQLTRDDQAVSRGLATWCLGKWEQSITDLPREYGTPPRPETARNWYVNSLGQTMVVLRPPSRFAMGSPDWESYRGESETQHWMEIGRNYAIAATETTRAEYDLYREDPRVKDFYFSEQYSPSAACPQTSLSQWDAARFCQWLSEREGIPEDQWCYPNIWEQEDGDEISLPADFLTRTGYRLPTAAEWEFACRSGTNAPRYFGELSRLAPFYACYSANSSYRTHPVASYLPNDFGLFDMLGNVAEWCQDRHGRYQTPAARTYRRDDFGDIVRARGPIGFELRGGHFQSSLPNVRAAERTRAAATTRSHVHGLRIVRTQ